MVLVGLTTDVCVSSTARDAFHNELYAVTLADCAAEQTLARYEAGLATLASCFGRVGTFDDILAAWHAPLAQVTSGRALKPARSGHQSL